MGVEFESGQIRISSELSVGGGRPGTQEEKSCAKVSEFNI